MVSPGRYIFAANLMLAFDLHEQNLRDSTQIQADLVEDNINRLMVRARKFTSSPEVKSACRNDSIQIKDGIVDISKDITNFTDETLDNVSIIALLDQDGNFLYTSGSNSDSIALKDKDGCRAA